MAALALAAVAYAANVYEVTPAKTTPGGAGTPAKPKPKAVQFGFTAADEDGGRATPIEKYSIRFQGLKSFAKAFPKCKIGQADGPSHRKRCKKAMVGGGTVNNQFGASDDPQDSNPCVLDLTLYNLGNGLALRLDGQPPACPVQIGQAIPARFASKRIGGKPGIALNFSVPENLLHPLPGIDNSVASVKALVSGKRRTVKIKRRQRKVSILASIACKRKKRAIEVLFTDESGDTVPTGRKVKC